jgi:hypothetical protein
MPAELHHDTVFLLRDIATQANIIERVKFHHQMVHAVAWPLGNGEAVASCMKYSDTLSIGQPAVDNQAKKASIAVRRGPSECMHVAAAILNCSSHRALKCQPRNSPLPGRSQHISISVDSFRLN